MNLLLLLQLTSLFSPLSLGCLGIKNAFQGRRFYSNVCVDSVIYKVFYFFFFFSSSTLGTTWPSENNWLTAWSVKYEFHVLHFSSMELYNYMPEI